MFSSAGTEKVRDGNLLAGCHVGGAEKGPLLLGC